MASHEGDLFRDKIEVKLDERQVFYLFFGGAVIVTLVFVLGVMVGRRVESRALVEGGSTVSDPLAALDRLEAGDSLAFPLALRGDEVSLGTVDSNLALRPTHPSQTGSLLEKPANKAEKRDLRSRAGQKKANASSASAKKPATPQDGKAHEAAAKSASTLSTSKPLPISTAKEKKKRRRFTLQVGSFQDKAEADTFFRSLEGGRYAPYMVEAKVPGKGTYFRVRVGGYPSFDEAVQAKSAFEGSQHIIAYVTRLK